MSPAINTAIAKNKEDIASTLGSNTDLDYRFGEQLDYFSLASLLLHNEDREWNVEQITELLKNNIIKHAFIQWDEVKFEINDKAEDIISTIGVVIDYGKRIQLDQSEVIDYAPRGKQYPNTVLAYSKVSGDRMVIIKKDGYKVDIQLRNEADIDAYIAILEWKGCTLLPEDYTSSFISNLLVDKWIGIKLK